MAQHVSVAAWVAQSPERLEAIERRSQRLIRATAEDHFRRLVAEWAAKDEGLFPSRAQAEAAAHDELEVVCRWLGRLGALEPNEVFPVLAVITTPHDDEGW